MTAPSTSHPPGTAGTAPSTPAASPDVVGVGGTILNGCSGTSCKFTSETTWSSSGGGISADERLPGYQSAYTGPVSGASTISALTGSRRGIPDASFDANPNTGCPFTTGPATTDSRAGSPSAAPASAHRTGQGSWQPGRRPTRTALQGDSRIYSGGYSTNLRDITNLTNGRCGTDCTAGLAMTW